MSQSQSAIREAVIRGHKVELLRLLERDSSQVNELDSDGVTLLMEAAANNHINVLTMLIEYKASVSPINRLGRSALMEAACRGHPAVTLRLCQARPNLDHVNEHHPLQMTSLMEAASRGHDGVVFWLCEAKANIDMKTTRGDTALILAAHNNRYDCVKVLVAQGAKLDIRGDNDRTALETAIERGHTRIVNLLSKAKIRNSIYLEQLCVKLKQEQKQVLQDEVNYDASVLSRKLPNITVYPALPYFAEELLEIPIPHFNRGYNSPQFEVIQQEFKKLRPDQEFPLTPDYLLNPSTYPVQPFTYDKTRHLPRVAPFKLMPRFGSCSWIAKSLHNDQRSRVQRVNEFNESLHGTQLAILTLFDNGTWTYKNDPISGDLHGTFQLYLVITHGTLSHIKNIPIDPLTADQDGVFWAPKNKTNTTTTTTQNQQNQSQSNNDMNNNNGTTTTPSTTTSPQPDGEIEYDPIEFQKLHPEYNWREYQHLYLVRLRTGGDGDPDSVAPLQIVDCYLGKQVVLGQLVMEMSEAIVPWWLYIDETEEQEDYEAYIAYEQQCNLIQSQQQQSQLQGNNNNGLHDDSQQHLLEQNEQQQQQQQHSSQQHV